MQSIAILGATGNLGKHVAEQALSRGWALSVAVRNRGRIPADIASRLHVTDLYLRLATTEKLASFAAGHDVFVSCAGVVTEDEAFVRLVDSVVTALESLQLDKCPVCSFLEGAALLPLNATGRLGVDRPKVRSTYSPHSKSYERLQRSSIGWRLLCPGLMVDQPAVGLERLRVSVDSLPTPLPVIARCLPSPLVTPSVRHEDTRDDHFLC